MSGKVGQLIPSGQEKHVGSEALASTVLATERHPTSIKEKRMSGPKERASRKERTKEVNGDQEGY
eukprot:1156460-Pelagomonas_calceolata.AAC.1